jgi:hypothetical protein
LCFRFSVLAPEASATRLALVSTLLTLVIPFLFAAVSAGANAMISITPISGMTLTMLIVTAVVLSSAVLKGERGILQTLLIGGVVCRLCRAVGHRGGATGSRAANEHRTAGLARQVPLRKKRCEAGLRLAHGTSGTSRHFVRRDGGEPALA